MLSTIQGINHFVCMQSSKSHACEAWQLLVKLFFSHRADLPTVASQCELSPAQCHVLHLIEPGQPIPMGRLAEALACDASNVTGLVDRLECRGLVRRQSSAGARRIKSPECAPAGCRLPSTGPERMTRPPDSLARLSAEEQQALVRILKR